MKCFRYTVSNFYSEKLYFYKYSFNLRYYNRYLYFSYSKYIIILFKIIQEGNKLNSIIIKFFAIYIKAKITAIRDIYYTYS